MSAKFSFHLTSQEKRRALPPKIIIGRQEPETIADVALKLLAFLIFFRERLLIEANLHQDDIPFVPNLVQLDYQLHPKLWVECGDCGVPKLHKLAIKMPDAEIWLVKPSRADAEQLLQAMAKAELRKGRYQILALDHEMFEEFCGRVQNRNELTWVRGGFDPPNVQFDFNGLWFDAPFTVLHH